MILRPHQENALSLLRQSVRSGHRRPLLSLCTGSGKTIIGAKAVLGARAKGNPVAFCVPSIGLVDQTAARFIANGIPADDIGIVQGDHAWRRDHAKVQICTAQTLARRDLPDSAVVFIDECHISFSIYKRWMTENPKTIFIGMSATPWSKGLGRWYDDLIKPISMQELIDKGYLSKFVAFAPPTVDLTGVHTVAGDFVEDELACLMNKPRLVADIVSTWLERGHGRPTLCFAVNRAHAKSIRDKFEQEGVRCAYVDAFTPREERDDIGVAMAEGVVQVTVNIGCLTTGTDWPHVSCIILARPTKSELMFVQIMGRGIRPIYPEGFDEGAATDEERAAACASMKDHCIARDSLVLTDKGEVKIQDVTLDHKVWDGVNYVAHAGAVCKGVQPVISHDGVTATPEHLVMTDEGWKTIEGAHRLGLRIARTGMGSSPIWFADDCLGQGGRIGLQPAGRSRVRKVQASAHGAVSQHAQAPRHGGVSALQWPQAGHCPEMAVSALPIAEGPLPKSIVHIFRSVWRAWDRISVFVSERRCRLGSGKPRHSGQVDGVGPQGQQRSLRAGEYPVGASGEKYEQYSALGWNAPKEVHQLSEGSPRNQIRGQNTSAPHWRDDRRSNNCPVVIPVHQAEREVWDIHNAGPLQRFTANGRLVHNCLFLDHSDSHTRLGMITDIDHSHLSLAKASRKAADGKEREEVVLPRACQCCGCLVPPRSSKCPSCGHTNVAPNQVDQIDGELVELRGAGHRPAKKGQTITAQLQNLGSQELKAQINTMRREGNWSNGRASHLYKDIMGVWPRGDWDFSIPYAEPCGILRSFERSRRIAYAKGMAAQKRA